MKMNLKRISLLLISGAVLFSFCGCSPIKDMSAKRKLKKYMAERYPDDSFTWVSALKLYDTEYMLSGFSEKYPDEVIEAYCNQYNGEWSFSDTYLPYYRRQDAEAYIKKIAERVFGECKVYEDIDTSRSTANSFPTDIPIENILMNSRPYFEIFLPPDGLSKEEAADGIKEFEKLLGGKEIYNVKGKVRIITDQEIYDNTVSENVPISGGVKNVLVVTVGELNSLNAKKSD